MIQTLSYLINGVLKEERYKKGANLAQPKSESGPEGTKSHAGVLSQPLPKLEPSILLLTRISSRLVVLEEIPA